MAHERGPQSPSPQGVCERGPATGPLLISPSLPVLFSSMMNFVYQKEAGCDLCYMYMYLDRILTFARHSLALLNAWVGAPEIVGRIVGRFSWVSWFRCIYREPPMIIRGKLTLCASKWLKMARSGRSLSWPKTETKTQFSFSFRGEPPLTVLPPKRVSLRNSDDATHNLFWRENEIKTRAATSSREFCKRIDRCAAELKKMRAVGSHSFVY